MNDRVKQVVKNLKNLGEPTLGAHQQRLAEMSLDDFLFYFVKVVMDSADYGQKRGYADGWLMAAEFVRREGCTELAGEMKEKADDLEGALQKEDFEMYMGILFRKDVATD